MQSTVDPLVYIIYIYGAIETDYRAYRDYTHHGFRRSKSKVLTANISIKNLLAYASIKKARFG